MELRRSAAMRSVLICGVVAVCTGGAGCSRKATTIYLPPVPMEELGAAPTGAVSTRPALPPGVCPLADSLGALPGDTLAPELLIAIPRLISMPPLVYPESERDQGWEGDISVRLLIRPDGRVGRVDVGDGKDPFVNAAAKAACGARFSIVRSATGEPAHVWITQTFAFRLSTGIPKTAPRQERSTASPE